jgi:hypothetical protein
MSFGEWISVETSSPPTLTENCRLLFFNHHVMPQFFSWFINPNEPVNLGHHLENLTYKP